MDVSEKVLSHNAALKTLLCIMALLSGFTGKTQGPGTMSSRIEKKAFEPSTFLWYNKNATKWEEALPVGNGRLGAMVYGNPGDEIIQLNEETLWSGGPYSTVVKGGYRHLPAIREFVFKGDMQNAQKAFGRHLMGYPVEQQKYQSMGNLVLSFQQDSIISDYKRWLDLETGITGLEYSAGAIRFKREVFSSAPDETTVIRLTANKSGSISFTAELRGERNQAHSNYATDYFRMNGKDSNSLRLTGKSADYLGVKGMIRYDARIIAVPEGGSMRIKDARLIIKNADAVTLYFIAATNFINYKNVSGDEEAKAEKFVKNILGKTYTSIKHNHLVYYQPLFKRVTLRLPATDNSFLPTNQRLRQNIDKSDPQLSALAYQFGRYLLISSSRPGTQAANLQGIWNDDMNPAWDSKYTTNINLEMNYWGVESSNLSEFAEPLIQLIKGLTDQGSHVAKEHYGARGWVCHQNTDLWRVAAPMDGPTWGTFTTGGAWLTTHLWEHFLYTRDTSYLKEIYPVIKGSVDFYMDFLVEDPTKKWLVTNPSTSPENFPACPGNGPYFDEITGGRLPGTTICAGSAIDMQILSDLFSYYVQASGILNLDKKNSNKVLAAAKRLVPPQIGKDGLLQEWMQDWEQLEKGHRHASHMYGVYPGNILSPKKTPSFIDACKRVLDNRGDGATGWSRAWKVALWARLLDGNRSNTILKKYFKEQTCLQLFGKAGAPMQVDASFGMMAGITEMLMQSHEGAIEFLPALPDEWTDGEFRGVCARGAFVLDIRWKNNILTEAEIFSRKGGNCRIKDEYEVKIKDSNQPLQIKKQENYIEFVTIPGISYMITPVMVK